MKRLQAYGVFSDTTLRTVEGVAKEQEAYATYQDYFASLNMPKPHVFMGTKRCGVPVVDIPSRQKISEGTVVIHLPMSNPLDPNQLFHIATIASALPAYRIISFGNPSGKPYKYRSQNRSLRQLFKTALTNDQRSLISPEVEYLRKQNITRAHHVGYSYGAHKALIEARYLQAREIASLTLVDPVAHPRGLRQLIRDFKSTFTPMGKFVNRTGLQIFFDARRDTSKSGHHMTALRRPVSVALGILMARFDMMPKLGALLAVHPTLYVSVTWGSKSELGNDAHMQAGLSELAGKYPGRVQSLRLKDDEHALANDIHLYAAIVHESLERFTRFLRG